MLQHVQQISSETHEFDEEAQEELEQVIEELDEPVEYTKDDEERIQDDLGDQKDLVDDENIGLIVDRDSLVQENIEEFQSIFPDWIKNNAGWWAKGQITDDDFSLGIQFLIDEGAIVLPPTQTEAVKSNEIPYWVKFSAGWWAEGLIKESEFIDGITISHFNRYNFGYFRIDTTMDWPKISCIVFIITIMIFASGIIWPVSYVEAKLSMDIESSEDLKKIKDPEKLKDMKKIKDPEKLKDMKNVRVIEGENFVAYARALYTTVDNPSNHLTPSGDPYDGVSELFLTLSTGTFGCSGVLLPTGQHVLTAAHCITDDFGNYNLQTGFCYFCRR